MSLEFQYHLASQSHPVLTLGGRWVRPKPLIEIQVSGPAANVAEFAILDTGSDETVFPESVAMKIGIDLSGAPIGTHRGFDRAIHAVRYAEVQLTLNDGFTLVTWRAWVGFSKAPMRFGLLGFAGCLQFFTATFRGDLEIVELEPNALLPPP